LKRSQTAGKRIFTIEYVGDPKAQATVLQRCARNGFLPTFGPRDLSSLVIDPTVLSPTYRGPLVPQEGIWP
jgi:endo-alpha-1,4-polygalactosaminidase (GH114 family)